MVNPAARLLLLLLLGPLVMCSGRRSDIEYDNEENNNYKDIIDNEKCGGAFDNGLDPECQPCDKNWCDQNCVFDDCDGDEACYMTLGICEEKGCPCPLYDARDLNISVNCASTQSVMEYDLSKLFNIGLDTSKLSINISMQKVIALFLYDEFMNLFLKCLTFFLTSYIF